MENTNNIMNYFLKYWTFREKKYEYLEKKIMYVAFVHAKWWKNKNVNERICIHGDGFNREREKNGRNDVKASQLRIYVIFPTFKPAENTIVLQAVHFHP